MGMTNIMLRNYWENKFEQKDDLEELQNLYKDEVMKYKLSKAAGEHFYSTMFKPITEKLEETIEPLKQIKELSEEQSKTMLPAPTIPIPIDAPPEDEEEDDDEFEEAEEGGVEEAKDKGPVWRFRPDENVSKETLDEYGLQQPSIIAGRSEKFKEDLKEQLRVEKMKLTKDINKTKKEGGNTSELEKMRKELDNYTDIIFLDRLKVGKGLYKIKRNRQYGSSYIDIPLLKKRKILKVVDGYGNPLLFKGNISKDFIDLITKRFNSKKKYKGSSIEAFKLLNKLSSTPANKRSKKISCTPTFYDEPRDLLEHLDLILGSIEAGNNNLSNEGIAVLDELLKIGAINREGHERIYKRFFT